MSSIAPCELKMHTGYIPVSFFFKFMLFMHLAGILLSIDFASFHPENYGDLHTKKNQMLL